MRKLKKSENQNTESVELIILEQIRKIKYISDRQMLCVLLIFGFIFGGFAYGVHLDQDAEQLILYSNVKGYLQHFRLEHTGLYADLDHAGVICIEENLDKYNGMAMYYPMFFVFYLNQKSPYIGNIIWQAYIYLLCMGGLTALFYLLRDIFPDRRVAVLGTLLYYFSPRMFAESHYNNKDMILLSLTLGILFFGRKLYQEVRWKWVILFAVIGSFATNAKIIGAFIWGMIGIYVLIMLIMDHRFHWETAVKMILCIGLWFAVYRIITPASASGVIEFWKYLIDSAKNFWWNDYVLFRGQLYNKTTTGMSRAYLPTIILLTTPIGILGLTILGGIDMVVKIVGNPREAAGTTGYIVTGIAACLIPVIYAVWNRTPDYNGWRHFYFFYAAILLGAAQGISFLLQRGKKQKAVVFLMGGYCLLLAGSVLGNHPYEYAFYNCLAGKQVETNYELDYWDMAFKQAYERILDRTEGKDISVGTISNPAYWGLEAQLYAIRGKQRMRISLCENWNEAEYLIINPTYAYMYAASDYKWIKQEYKITDQIQSYGNVICEIYQKVQ